MIRREFNRIGPSRSIARGRSLQDLIGFLSEIHAAGIDSVRRVWRPRRLAGNANWAAWKAILLVRVFAILTSINSATNGCGFVPRSRRFQKPQEPSSHAKRFPSGKLSGDETCSKA